MSTPFIDRNAPPSVRGFFDQPAEPSGDALVLTHGAGANCQSKLLVALGTALAATGFMVLRFDLPFRQERPHGPPAFGSAAQDREGIRRAVAVMKQKVPGRIFLGGHSYGGRQETMLLAEEPQLADGLLLLSYPLHPPRRPDQLRTSHFPRLAKPAFFVHGTRDAFGSIGEMESALELIPARRALLEVEGAGHDLLGKNTASELLARIVKEFRSFLHS
jgi:uncharacterized protein